MHLGRFNRRSLVLHIILCFLPPAAGIEPNETSTNFDRMYQPYDPPLSDCDATRDSKCLILPDPDRTAEERDMLRNIRQMITLSMYIYQYVTLRQVALKTNNTELHKILELPRTASDLFRSGQKYDPAKTDDVYQTIATCINNMENDEERRLKLMKVISIKDDVMDVKKSLVYGVVVDEHHRRVIVVFRGSATRYDWMKNINFKQKREYNPVYESFGTKAMDINIHAGFAKALLSESRSMCKYHEADHQDLDQSPFYEGTLEYSFSQDVEQKTQRRLRYECIFDVIRPYMQQGYRLFVTGHSLGGALATLFGFYAAADDDFTRNGPVTVYTFASPRVGDRAFRGSFKHLEKRGRLRHARIHNHLDKVALLPLNYQSYKHVGIDLQLFQGDEPPTIDYPAFREWGQRGPKFLKNIRSLPQVLQLHSQKTMLDRVHRWETLFANATLENEYLQIWNRGVP